LTMGRPVFRSMEVKDVEETVFGSVKKNFSRGVVDREVGKDDGLVGIVIPRVAGSLLIMPDVFAGVGFERNDGADEEIVAAAGAASGAVPGSAVADAEIDEIEIGVVGDGVPDGAASAEFPPLAGPGFCGFFENGRLKWLGRIARHGVEAPGHFSGVGIVGGDVAAHAVFRSAIADQDFALHDAGCASNRVAVIAIDGKGFPGGLAGGGIEGHEAAIERGDENFAAPNGNAAIDDVATGIDGPFGRDLGIVRPEFLAGSGFDGEDFAPRGGEVHDAIYNNGCRLITAVTVEIHVPGESELADVLIVDLLQRTEALLVVGAAIAHPVAGVIVSVDEARGVNVGRGGCFTRGR